MTETAPEQGLSPAARSLAAWLFQHEAGDADEPNGVLTAERICQKLSVRLARLVTTEGSRALLARALHLAAVEAAVLQGVRVNMLPGTCLDGVAERTLEAPPEQLRAGLVAMVGELVGLLARFFGEDLMGRLIHDVWPEAPVRPGATDPGSQEAA